MTIEHESKGFIVCKDCNERLEYKENWAAEHMKKYPDHRKYRLIDIM